jgi:UDP:flavonoid glycosyltransferase YjiC (YdhE family)
MKALIFTHGTRGDVQPFVALAHALQQAGHETVLAVRPGRRRWRSLMALRSRRCRTR